MSLSWHKRFLAVLLVLLALTVALYVRFKNGSAVTTNPDGAAEQAAQQAAAQCARIETKEQQANQTVWAKEILAEECGRIFESLWDQIRVATNKLNVAANFPLGQIVLSKWSSPHKLPHEIEIRQPAGSGAALSPEDWRRFVGELQRAGWHLVQTEFRHNQFDTDDAGQPKQSRFYFSAHLTNSMTPERAVVEGDLVVDWAAPASSYQAAIVKQVDASHLTLRTRAGEPAFRPILVEQIAPTEGSFFIDPLILYDLDGDGLPEIILAANNLAYHRRPDGTYESRPLCRYSPGLIFTGVIADFDGDGVADFLCATFEGLYLYKGSPQGTFDEPGRLVWSAPRHLKYVTVLTCGDIDHDGDLDVFLAQYKLPYDRGAMPTPYYDANDGNPAYLLLNDGHGNFTDATIRAGLGQKRWRHSYSGSLVDLDGDGHLDLIVVSDFAGLDLYRNDGKGHFSDVTAQWASETHAFGMGHAVADFDGDGRLDLLVLGMPSPTVDRLEHLKLWRSDVTEDRTMRARMSCGNRLYLSHTNGGFEQTALSDSIARSGWSWGCSAFDFDNDGYPDVYIANGHESKITVHDYESEFWLHDIYVGDSKDDLAAFMYFDKKIKSTRGQGYSYGGYDKNRLYWNQGGTNFEEIAHLMGVALEQDSRNVMAADLDGDGRMDLLVTTFEVWPQVKQTLQVYKNTLPDSGNWIGFRFREGPGGSPVGARVTVHYAGRIATQAIVVGDSYRSQHANIVHFGLSQADQVDSVEIKWPNGQIVTLHQPAINRYHDLVPPR